MTHSEQKCQTDQGLLCGLAQEYVWWKPPGESMTMPERVIAQVMNIGDYEDARTMADQVGDDALRAVLTHAEAGQFNERSWHYWHYRLGLAKLGEVPPMPSRKLGQWAATG